MESNITKILIKKFWKRCVTLPWIVHMRYGPPLFVLTFTDDPPLWGPSLPPPKKKRTFPNPDYYQNLNLLRLAKRVMSKLTTIDFPASAFSLLFQKMLMKSYILGEII